MRKLVAWVVVCAIIVLGGSLGISFADASPSPWVSPAAPTLQKLSDLPDNSLLAENNIDCSPITTRMASTFIMVNECVNPTAYGLVGSQGITFTGSSETILVVPPSPFSGLNPIPRQGMLYTYTSASGGGLYMGFYRSIRDKMKLSPDLINGTYRFTLTSGPDFLLTNLAGHSQPVNPKSLAFSPNGDWMVVDLPYQGYVRVNLATFEMMPFAPSMNAGGDYANYSAQVAISNDGRYVALKPGNTQAFRVYDVASCVKATMPYDYSLAKCPSRDYWVDLNAQLPGLKALYQPRFSSEMQLSVTAQYQYSAAGYKAALINLTAPGENPSGIEYLGMGDSYASGQGAFNYIAGTDTSNNTCHLSSLSYPFLLSTAVFNTGHSVACSGAVTQDISGREQTYTGQNTPHQSRADLERLQMLDPILANYTPGYLLQSEFADRYNPANITLSIGGNDIGFQDIVSRCVTPAIFGSTCYASKEDQQELVDRITSTQSALQNTYRALKTANRKVYVIGYPQIVVSGGNCAANVHLNANEIKLFIDLTNLLNQTIQAAAAQEGVQYVDVSEAFKGHRMCETNSSAVAVNGLTAGTDMGAGIVKVIGAESFHPNALGHELLKQAILSQTDHFNGYGKAVPITPAPALPYADAPTTGRSTRLTMTDNELAPDIIAPQTPLKLKIDPSLAQLKGSSSFTATLDDSQAALGSATTDLGGTLSGTITLPPDTTCGHHTLHLVGPNIIGRPLDIYKEVYVTPAIGCGDTQSKCGIVADSGVDADKDGIDDACDPLISDPPAPHSFIVYLTGSSFHVTKASADPTVSPVTAIQSDPTTQPLNDAVLAAAQTQPAIPRQAWTNYTLLGALVTLASMLGYIIIRRSRYQQS